MLAVGTIQIATRIDEINYDELQCLQTVEDLDSFDAKDGKIVKYTGNDPKYKKGFDYMRVIENGNKTWIPIISENDQVQVDWNQIDSNAVDYIKNKPDLSTFASKADLNDKADKSEIITSYNQLTDTPVIPEIPDTSNFALKSDIPDTSQFAKKSDIPDTSKFLTKDDLPEIPSNPDLSDIRAELENKADLSLLNNKVDVDALNDYATKNDLDNLATKNDLANKADLSDIVTNYDELSNKPTKLSDFIDDLPDPLTDLTFTYNKEDVTLEIKNGDALITSIGVADFVKDGMINSVELNYNVLTITFNTDAGKQPINIDLSNIVPSLDGYATEQYVDDSLDEINEALKKVVNGETPVGKEYTAGEGININDNVISADTTKLATKTDLEGFARWEDIPNPNLFATKEELENKADKSEIPDVSNFITRDDIPEDQDLSEYAKKKEVILITENLDKADLDFSKIYQYGGEDNDKYIKGHLYKYSSNSNIIINSNTKYLDTRDLMGNSDEDIFLSNLNCAFGTKVEKIYKYEGSDNIISNIFPITNIHRLATSTLADNYSITALVVGDIKIGAKVSSPYAACLNNRASGVGEIIEINGETITVDFGGGIFKFDIIEDYPDITSYVSDFVLIGDNDFGICVYSENPFVNIFKRGDDILIGGIPLLYPNNDLLHFTSFTESPIEIELKGKSGWVDVYKIPNTDEFVTRNELPNFSEFATTSQLADKADRSDIPSLEGYATEEYVDNAVANAGGSGSTSGNYLKLVDNLDNYKAAEGEIVKYSGESNDKYIQGADYKYIVSAKNMTIASGINYAYRLVITNCDDSNFNNLHLIKAYNQKYPLIIHDENLPVEPLRFNYNNPYCVYWSGNLELNKEVIVQYGTNVKYGTITNINGDANTVTFEGTNIVIDSSFNAVSFMLEVIEEIAKVVYRLTSGFDDNKNAFLFYDNDKLKMLMYTESDVNKINTPYDITGVKVKHIELTDFCKRALNIEQ